MSPEGLCHIVDGSLDCSFSQGDDIIVRKASLLHGLGEGGKEESAAPRLAEGLEVGVVFDSDVLEEIFSTNSNCKLAHLGSDLLCCLDGQLPQHGTEP